MVAAGGGSERRTCLAASRMEHVAAAACRGSPGLHLRHLVRVRRDGRPVGTTERAPP